jgi:hypothetical protein
LSLITLLLERHLKASIPLKRDRKQLNIFERKVYRRILGPVYDIEKEDWKILTNKQIYAIVKKPTITETIRLHRLVGLDLYREWKKIEFPKEYCIWIWNQQDQEVDQEIDGKMK